MTVYLILQPIEILVNVSECPAGYSLLRSSTKEEYSCYCDQTNSLIIGCNETQILVKVSCHITT